MQERTDTQPLGRLVLNRSDRVERRGVMAALDLSQCLVWFDPDGRIIDANTNTQNLIGAPLDVLTTRTYADLIGEAGKHAAYATRQWTRIRDGDLRSEERGIHMIDGTEIWSSISYATVRREDGVPRRVLGIIIDLTPWSWRPKDSTRANSGSAATR